MFNFTNSCRYKIYILEAYCIIRLGKHSTYENKLNVPALFVRRHIGHNHRLRVTTTDHIVWSYCVAGNVDDIIYKCVQKG
jgi:hypothetical protein